MVVITGFPKNIKNVQTIIHRGRLEVSKSFNTVSNSTADCENYTVVGGFVNGMSYVKMKLENIKCFRIFIETGKQTRIVIREIEIFLF